MSLVHFIIEEISFRQQGLVHTLLSARTGTRIQVSARQSGHCFLHSKFNIQKSCKNKLKNTHALTLLIYPLGFSFFSLELAGGSHQCWSQDSLTCCSYQHVLIQSGGSLSSATVEELEN